MYRGLKCNNAARLFVLFPLLLSGAWAQPWDLGARLASAVSEGTENKLKLSFEQRGRYEDLTGSAFGLEAALQKGKAGPVDLSAGAWFAGLSRRWTIARRPLDVSEEYTYASCTKEPSDVKHSGTFDRLYAANHNMFGHQDLLGWRNMHNTRAVAALGLTQNWAVNFLYDNSWLASLRDGISNGSGKFKYKHFTLGAGYGYFFAGPFIQKTTPGVGPTYLYVFHSDSL
jgi:hypothetical protein